ncbi:MAG: hypothetical protein IKL51_00085 [Lachnospiraceae bacterium]|nr:hypothetical protein [Lachnospiraceae bacterium]
MATKNITLKFNEETCKKSMTLNSSTLKRWESFLEKNGAKKDLMMTAALEHFMNEYESEAVKVLIEL